MTKDDSGTAAHVTPQLSDYAQHVIAELGLAPHPEGGWYRRTWQSALAADATGDRPLASCIYFLLPAGDASAWHVVDADELWLWHGPGAVTLELGGNGEQPNERDARRVTLLVDKHGACGELVVPAGVWQRTIPSNEDALVSCVVSPGFTFAGFKLASRD
ncbi:cupin domain-containing protein [Olsenella sp. AF16-14LB]|uniref:cupin domain-containing protein n=1 Tax=unclassified Olsenella TaxID=2638792 RepID=UPI000E46E7D2|nr:MULTISPECIES: cupin domain-containing protein [unclassified Olsenella]RGU50137.1 cupin domain-containing protein [Olsenella sp. AF16-14LB]RGU81289.1 cupin domain-containing protein [Olsenella sp. AF15-43LB]